MKRLPERSVVRSALALYFVAALSHVFIVLVVHSYAGGPLGPDAAGYDVTSAHLAGLWRSGVSLADIRPAAVAGTEVWGFHFVIAAGRYLTGGGWLAGKVVVALIAASAAPAAYLLVASVEGSEKMARTAGAAVAMSPTLLFWNSVGLKDGLVVAVLLWVLVAQRHRSLIFAAFVTVVGIQACLYLRPAAAVALGAALFPRVPRWAPRSVTALFVLAVAATAIVLPRIDTLASLIPSLSIHEGQPLSFGGGPREAGWASAPAQVASSLFGPFPWAYGEGTAVPERWLYIGTTVWIALVGLALPSLRAAWRDTAGRPLVLAMAAYALVYLTSFGGAFYRQRSVVEVILLIIVVRWWPLARSAMAPRVAIWMGGVAAFAILQSSDLTPTPVVKVTVMLALLALLLEIYRRDTRAWPRSPGRATQ